MTKVVLVGEAWGANEALWEHAFVGAAGRELGRLLADANLAPKPTAYASELDMIKHWKRVKEDCDIELANVFNARPADNNIEEFFAGVRDGLTSLPPFNRTKYLKPEMLFHVEALWKLLTEKRPNLIIAFGNTACWATLGETKISAIRGTVKISPRLGLKVLPTFHPSAVLRQWNLRAIVLSDLEKASREAEFADVRRIERWLTVNPTLAEIEEWLTRPAEYYAVDIENPKVKVGAKPIYLRDQIAMIGFARSPTDAVVIPFFDETKPGGNYWPEPRQELKARRLAEKALQAPIPKIFQNGIYDLSHLLRQGYRPTMCHHDTMLLHHALYPEMLKGLGFLGSIYSDEVAWKQMSGRGDNLKRDA